MINIPIPWTNDVAAYGRQYTVNRKDQFQTRPDGALAYAIPRQGQPISNLPADGTIALKLNESNILTKFLLLKHDYESSSRSLILRNDCYDARGWNASDVSNYADCDADIWMNTDYYNTFGTNEKELIEPVEIVYTVGNGSTVQGKISRRFFWLSGTELGFSVSKMSVEGTAIPYFNDDNKRISTLNGVPINYNTRSPQSGANRGWMGSIANRQLP